MSPAQTDGGPAGETRAEQVARNVRNAIEAGNLRHGMRLASTRELASQWGVSVATIDQAMQILADEGLIKSKARSGRTVNAPDQVRSVPINANHLSVVLIGGYAGSGKTELGRILARQTGWPMLDKDTITRPVVEFALEALGLSPNDRESERYIAEVRPREYEALQAAIAENLICRNSVIATAPFMKEFADSQWIARMRSTVENADAVLSIVWVYCDAPTMHTYVRHRGAARDARKLDDWSTYVKTINVDFRPASDYMLIDNSAAGSPLSEQAAKLAERLAQPA